jgi:hypothetical protein
MGLFSKRLMKWREPKVKGWLTPKNILAMYVLIGAISIPFGFLGGNGKFNVWICFLAAGFMSAATIGLLIRPLLPGTLVQLREDMIVRGARGTSSHRSAYRDIECVYFYRDCSYSMSGNSPVILVHQRNTGSPGFTSFEVVMKNEKTENEFSKSSFANFYSVKRFAVPDNVSLEQVLQILGDKGVKVVEPQLPH